MKRRVWKWSLFLLVVAALFVGLMACVPYEDVYADRFPIQEGEENELLKDHTDKDRALDLVDRGIHNLLDHLNGGSGGENGYYVGADLVYNTLGTTTYRASFVLKLRANLYTHNYYDSQGNVIEEELKKHNDIIRYSDIILEWYDGTTNAMLIGFYFDGINPTSADRGNNLYLNLQGTKRIFPNFGDSVLFQQMIRLITQFNLDNLLAGMDGESSDGAIGTFREMLGYAVQDNYKHVLNGAQTSVYLDNVDLGTQVGKLSSYLRNFFAPFEDKLDPLTNKYLGFRFSTLAHTDINSLNTDMQFLSEPADNLAGSGPDPEMDKIMTGAVVDARGAATVSIEGREREQMNYVARVAVAYSLRLSTDILFDKSDYVLYDYGKYEYEGDMFIPPLDLKLDAKIRTDVNDVPANNALNRVWAEFRDKANDDLIIGGYYANELTYLDISGLMDLYGGIKFEDLGLPQAYRGGFNLSELLEWVFDTIDTYIVSMVDYLLSPGGEEGTEDYTDMINSLMDNVFSTVKDPNVPESRNTISILIDIELIRNILRETSETGTEWTDDQMIQFVNDMFDIDLEAIAAILGMNVKQLMRNAWFYITYDVDEYSIRVDMHMNEDENSGTRDPQNTTDLWLRLDLWPNKIGEAVTIVFPDFSHFNPLQRVMTYSGNMNGQFIFAASEDVDLSDLLGVFMGDKSGLNTPYVLPDAADIYFTLYYDQYIREQILSNGRWTRAGRSALNLSFYVMEQSQRTEILRVYANDIGLDSTVPVEQFGYIWVDYVCVPGMPRFKLREDVFIRSFYEYMGVEVNDDTEIVMGLTDILRALLEDSWPVFEPDVIRITTSNQTIKDFFRVDELIGTVEAQIGFKQRVLNIDELESNFAMYTVGDFADISGTGIYSVRLHDTIPVTFDFGSRVETHDLRFRYSPQSIAVVDGNLTYHPTFDGLFMGVSRQYTVNITSPGMQGRNSIKRLRYDSERWEPLESVPTTTQAYYTDQAYGTYDADYRFFAYLTDVERGYYVVLNDLDYRILYDAGNDAYVVDLYRNFKYNDAYDLLGEGATVYPYDWTNDDGVELIYELGSRLAGWYAVKNFRNVALPYNVLYNRDGGYYLVESEAHSRALRAELGAEATIRVLNAQRAAGDKTHQLYFDMRTGLYLVTNTTTPEYLYFDPNSESYWVADGDAAALALAEEGVRAAVEASLAEAGAGWGKHPFDNVDWAGEYYNTSISWAGFTWEDITLEGGKFKVLVVIGEGMMATYRQMIDVLVVNRRVDTDEYVNVVTEQGRVSAPVAGTLLVDPYVYVLLKADYVNGQRGDADAFATWYFGNCPVTVTFTTLYGNPEDDTPPARSTEEGFQWSFDAVGAPGAEAIYSESDISNRVQGASDSEGDVTYIHMTFKGQVIALAVRVLPRSVKHVVFEGEEPGTYTVDALFSETYVLPTNPTIVFEQTDAAGNPYTLRLDDLTPAASTIFGAAWVPVQPQSRQLVRDPAPYTGEGMRPPETPIIWTNPVVDNARLTGNYDAAGRVFPWQNSSTNETTAFLDLQSYVDFGGSWFDEEWFFKEILHVTVEIPDKEVATTTVHVTNETPSTTSHTVSMIEAEGGWGELQAGLFMVDPYDSRTWQLPGVITVYFLDNRGGGAEGGVYSAPYPVTWYEVEGGTWEPKAASSLVSADGRLSNITTTQHTFFAGAEIGNAEVGTIRVVLVVDNLSGNMREAAYLDVDQSLLAGELDGDGNPTGAYADVEYRVDTYTRFAIPAYVRVAFADQTVRTYPTAWGNFPDWTPGRDEVVNNTLGDAGSLTADTPLRYRVEDREILTIRVDRYYDEANPDYGDLTYTLGDADKDDGTFTLSDVVLRNAQINGRTPYEFFTWLFGSITLTLTESEWGFEETITLLDAVESNGDWLEVNFDTQRVVRPEGNVLTLFLGQWAGADDYTLTIRAAEKPEVQQFKELSDAVFHDQIMPYNTDNTLRYPNGYVFVRELSLSIDQVYAAADDPNAEENYITPRRVNVYDEVGGLIAGCEYITEWIVSAPTDPALYTQEMVDLEGAEYGEPASTIPGIREYDRLTELSLDQLLLGGHVWLTAMLSDSSRVYARVSVEGVNIGSHFNSAPGSLFEVRQGELVIDDYYRYYPYADTLRPENLPSVLEITAPDGTYLITVSNVQWTLQADVRPDAISYQGLARTALATANVMNQELTLYLTILDGTIQSFAYTDAEDSTRSVASEAREGEVIPFYFDAYQNRGYGGNFQLPTTLQAQLAGGATHTFEDALFLNVTVPVAALAYDYRGLLPDGNDVDLILSVLDQQANVHLHFYDKQVTGYYITDQGEADAEGKYKAHADWSAESGTDAQGLFTIDPYGQLVVERDADGNFRRIAVPAEVLVRFAEGPDLLVTTQATPDRMRIEWDYGTEYEVAYDTYQRVQASGGAFRLSTALNAPGLGQQWLTLDVAVADRQLETWTMEGNDPGTVIDYRAAWGNPSNAYQYKDPFAGRASDLPARITDASQLVTTLSWWERGNVVLQWAFADDQISAQGTAGTTGMVVTGYLGNTLVDADVAAAIGQPMAIRVYMDEWTYDGIRRPQEYDGEGNVTRWMIMSEDIRFYFDWTSGESSEPQYQMIIRSRDARTGEVQHFNREFYTEEHVGTHTYMHDPTDGDAYESPFNSRGPKEVAYPYVLQWDADARIRAQENGEATGSFYLVNDRYAALRDPDYIKLRPTVRANYQFDRPNVTQLDLGYGYGTDNNAIYVVNLFHPVFGTGDTPWLTPARAKVVRNQGEEEEWGGADSGATVEVVWGQPNAGGGWTLPAFVNNHTYLRGGVYQGYPVTVRVRTERYTFTQQFRLLILFLDLSPVNDDAGQTMQYLLERTVTGGVFVDTAGEVPHAAKLTATSRYTLDRYGTNVSANPYREIYAKGEYVGEGGAHSSPAVDALNQAAAAQGEWLNYDVSDVVWNATTNAAGQLQVAVTRDTVVRSSRFTVRAVQYSSDILKLRFRPQA